MKKFLFLSSAFLMTMAGAHAADKIITNANTCTVDVLGVADNNATANTIATWDLIDYECGAGQYLLNSDGVLECTECPVGSYCPGGTYTVESENMGKNTCPADYTSDAAATAESECYMGCELACSTNAKCPPHSKNCTHSEFKTTGKQYINATCNAYPSICPITDFECNKGYTKTDISIYNVLEEILSDSSIIYNPVLSCSVYGTDDTNGTSVYLDTVIPDNGIDDCSILEPGHVVYTVGSNILKLKFALNDYDADTAGVIKKVSPNGKNEYLVLENADFSGVTGNKTVWATIEEAGPIDLALLSNILILMDNEQMSDSERQKWMENNLSAEAIESFNKYTTSGEDLDMLKFIWHAGLYDTGVAKQNIWVGWKTDEDATNKDVSNLNNPYIMLMLAWGGLLADYIDLDTSMCTANTININWNPDNGDAVIQNQCLYNVPIELPADPVKPGYTFTGWKLVE